MTSVFPKMSTAKENSKRVLDTMAWRVHWHFPEDATARSSSGFETARWQTLSSRSSMPQPPPWPSSRPAPARLPGGGLVLDLRGILPRHVARPRWAVIRPKSAKVLRRVWRGPFMYRNHPNPSSLLVIVTGGTICPCRPRYVKCTIWKVPWTEVSFIRSSQQA
eukprot:CAMPEP_0115544720 /NCGR_PEP_ID=MMETSP0271-20121206/92234_1 /TAXON_ID=71861 /ORGANISM="Scrippsiella trochoidea, Strain CCMP3099" /LENGTH=162 /DNA_ID=CAMNT_0002978045 /DNA_START=101 /DNA_END=590 /DNA_ORIENTATION=+